MVEKLCEKKRMTQNGKEKRNKKQLFKWYLWSGKFHHTFGCRTQIITDSNARDKMERENSFQQNTIPSAEFFRDWQSKIEKKWQQQQKVVIKRGFFHISIFMVIQLNDLVTVRLTLSCYTEMTTTTTTDKNREYKSIHITLHHTHTEYPICTAPLLVLFVELHHFIIWNVNSWQM